MAFINGVFVPDDQIAAQGFPGGAPAGATGAPLGGIVNQAGFTGQILTPGSIQNVAGPQVPASTGVVPPQQQPQPNLGTGFGQQAPLLQGQQGPVVDLFASELGRNPDQAGLDFFRERLASGVPIETIRAQIAASPEAQQRGAISAIPTGLSGSELALTGGLQGQLDALNRFGGAGLQSLSGAQNQANQLFGQGRGDVTQAFNQATQGLQPFQQGGQGAFDLLAAQSGALGPEAQQQAFQSFQDSPATAFLREQGLRRTRADAAAGQRLQGGEFQRDLSRFNQGLATQDLTRQQQLNQALAGQGLQAAGQIGGFRAQEGGLLSALAQNQAGQAFNFGQAGSNLLTNLGANQAGAIGGTATNIAAGRDRFGQNLAGAVSQGAGSVSALQQAGGAGASDILGTAGINAANLIQNFGNLSAADQQQLAVLLANLQTQQGSQLAGQASPAQFIQSGGIVGDLGQLASGVGGAISGASAAGLFNTAQPAITGQPLTTINTGAQFGGFA